MTSVAAGMAPSGKISAGVDDGTELLIGQA
jgi:hypothetical protein